MATMQVATATSAAPTVTDPEAVRELLHDEYTLGLNVELEGFDEDQLVIWGYDTFSPWSHDNNGDIVDGVGDELLYRLSQYIKDGDQLTLRTGGFTKCRSVCAHQWTVHPDIVVYSDLTTDRRVVSPPDTLAEVMSESALDGLGDIEALPESQLEEYGIGPRIPEHRQKYPDSLVKELEDDDRITNTEDGKDHWEFNDGQVAFQGSAGEVRAFAAGRDGRSRN